MLLRVAFAPVIVFVLFNGVFLLLEVAPDPDVATLAGGDPLCGRRVELDEFDTLPMCKSTGEQYRDFWERVFTLDFGKSFFNNRPISDSIEERWGSSAELVVLAVLFSVLIAFGLGAAPAFRQSRVGTPGARFVGAVLMGAPLVAVATYAIVYPFEWWNYAPPVGRSISFFQDPIGSLKQFIPPALTIGAVLGPWSSRLVRRLFSVDSPSVRSAGLAAATVAADVLPWVLGSLVVVEFVYAIPGLGQYQFRSIFILDSYATEAVTLLFALFAVAVWVVRPLTPAAQAVSAPRSVDRHWIPRNPLLMAGLAIVASYVIVGIIGPWVAPYDARDLGPLSPNKGPSFGHFLGTGRFGQDTLSRVLEGGRSSLKLSATALAIGFLPGTIAGLLVSRGPARLRDLVSEAAGLWFALPLIVVSLIVARTFDSDFWPLALCFGLHAFMLALRATASLAEYRTAPWRQIRAWAPLAGAAAVAGTTAILGQTTLSYFGLADPFGVTWGSDIGRANSTVVGNHWASWSPFVAVLISASGFLLIRTSLDDVDPPRMYER